MKVVLDHRRCAVGSQRSCETCLATYMHTAAFDIGNCGLRVSDDGHLEVEFVFIDRQGRSKTMKVKPASRREITDAWILKWLYKLSSPRNTGSLNGLFPA